MSSVFNRNKVDFTKQPMLFGEDQKFTNLKVMDYHIVGKKQFNEWFKEVNRKRIFKP